MSWYETQPYDVSLDTYPVGTRMPSVLTRHSYHLRPIRVSFE
jgi:hypothetical protein